MIKKAIFPAAGLGTRFLPATKAQPKEMLPVVDKPIIQYAVEEAVNSGIDEIIIVTGRNKRAIEDHFDISFELEYFLQKKGELDLLKQVREISELATVYYIRQKEPLGLGHAVLVTKELVKNEPFAVILSDDLIVSDVPCIKQMIEIYERYKCSVIAVEKVPREEVKNYGVIAGKEIDDGIYQVTDLVEKPLIEEAPSDLAIVGRYILTPGIFYMLEKVKPGRGGEIQLTDGLKLLLEKEAIYAYEFKGKRYDTGSKLGFLIASVELALKREGLGEQFREYLKSLRLD
ncbi:MULTISPECIES: UTP--glucose-1-phosphate uridylyltransferase GalU [Dictyoglomus]|jgi:UTP--glucose-1-phosphate uridylyltransferase|uniref:UTP--glucose-1-phosphate uridylyltransferase n=1 Tax=Dictyoglomus turgidum (strain DSM 6724 / Z-1310) TaxID=515635 RepID=B8E2Q6_DICTD|nr:MULTISPECIES: UTP--glucose-1-phosphate uridylyltransferase GalU [Dictyoglomus]ACK42900.1 UTP-glucose-1-phosphate uridylyltransferase [Dictyoglomus turgidum DSM 6724]HBU30962.1 UTP--glucose-1-phosphate uridylyltransferase [Dictyoglomus sp.]